MAPEQRAGGPGHTASSSSGVTRLHGLNFQRGDPTVRPGKSAGQPACGVHPLARGGPSGSLFCITMCRGRLTAKVKQDAVLKEPANAALYVWRYNTVHPTRIPDRLCRPPEATPSQNSFNPDSTPKPLTSSHSFKYYQNLQPGLHPHPKNKLSVSAWYITLDAPFGFAALGPPLRTALEESKTGALLASSVGCSQRKPL